MADTWITVRGGNRINFIDEKGEGGICSGQGHPAILFLSPAEAAKGSRVLFMLQDIGITSGTRASGTQHQLQRIVEGLVPAGTGKEELHLTRDWDPFRLGPATPSSA